MVTVSNLCLGWLIKLRSTSTIGNDPCTCGHIRMDHDRKSKLCNACPECEKFTHDKECKWCKEDETPFYKNDRTPCACVFCWRYKRQPRNFDIVHLFEAIADSANQMLVRENYEGVADRIHRIIGICRELIRAEPTTNFDRCRYRHNPRMRCNLPLIDGKCVDHGYNDYHDLKQNTLDDWNLHPPVFTDMEVDVR